MSVLNAPARTYNMADDGTAMSVCDSVVVVALLIPKCDSSSDCICDKMTWSACRFRRRSESKCINVL